MGLLLITNCTLPEGLCKIAKPDKRIYDRGGLTVYRINEDEAGIVSNDPEEAAQIARLEAEGGLCLEQ